MADHVALALTEQARRDRLTAADLAEMDGVAWVRLAIRAEVPPLLVLDARVRDGIAEAAKGEPTP